MDWLDIGIVGLLVGAMWRGAALGLVQQVVSTAGLVSGLFAGAFLESKLAHLAHTTTSRTAVALVVVWGCAAALWSGGEWLGAMLKQRIDRWHAGSVDAAFGSFIAGVTLLLAVWLGAAVFGNVPAMALRQQIHSSKIIATLDDSLPAAPNVIAKIGRLIDPNGFPQVFTGLEPAVSTNAPLPNLGSMSAAVAADRASVVKIEGNGCGGVVEGSGFVVADGVVATNAHVVAGITHPEILDGSGEHDARVVWFDPNLDFAVLRANGLSGAPLAFVDATLANGTPAAVLGYPGGGPFTAVTARVLESFDAVGRNIYNQGETTRNVYSVKATIVPGNSGGPLVTADGRVGGIVFAQSTVYNQVGYALAMHHVIAELRQAELTSGVPTSTGQCAE